MRSLTRDGVEIQIETGDITDQPELEAVVNAANAQLKTGGGVAGAIHRAAGPELTDETRPLAPIEPGEAAMTGGHDLPNDHIVHCLGPRSKRDQSEDELLAACYDHALALTEDHDLQSIGFSALSTGSLGYPIDEAIEIALRTVWSRPDELESVDTVRFVLFLDDDREVYERHLSIVADG